MFTGIITHIGTVLTVDASGGDRRFVIGTLFDMDTVAIGASIACDGCCLTVVQKDAQSFVVDVSAESLSKTALGAWTVGRKVNLERSLKLGDELGGHIVSGHVDGLATVESVTREGDSHRLKIRSPAPLAHYIASKGSVALNGISLTVNEVEGDVFGINIIPHTWTHTNIGQAKPGDKLNMEIDMLARYVARMMGKGEG